MIVSTRGRYALRVMIDIAEQGKDSLVALKDIVERQGIPRKYVENIMTVLSKNGMLKAFRGKGGGYKLNRPLNFYVVGDILRITEGTLAPVACLEENSEPCERIHGCRTLPLWSELNSIVQSYLDSVTLADLVQTKKPHRHIKI